MTRTEVLETANKMVTGQREKEYGAVENNFACIAELWSAYKDVDITPLDVAMMMTLLKLGRIKTGTAKNDSFVDAAGYIACGGEIATEPVRGRSLPDTLARTYRPSTGDPYLVNETGKTIAGEADLNG